MFKNSIILGAIVAQSLFSAPYRVVGYMPDYRASEIANIDWNVPTHVIVAFLNPDNNGDFRPSTGMQEIIAEAKTHANLRVYVSIAGAAVPGNWGTMINAANRGKTATDIAQAAVDLGVQGVDVDLEGSLVESADYDDFVAVLGKALDAKGLKMTAALAEWTAESIEDTTLAKFEFINLMAYDETGSWAGSVGQHSPYSKTVTDLNYFTTSRKVPKDKMVVGVPFYGYDFGTLTKVTDANAGEVRELLWSDIVANYPEALDLDQVKNSTVNIFYNGRTTIRKKANLAAQYGGIMIWELGQDVYDNKDNSLLHQIAIVKDSVAKSSSIHTPMRPQASQHAILLDKANVRWDILNGQGQLLHSGTTDNQGLLQLPRLPQQQLWLRHEQQFLPLVIKP